MKVWSDALLRALQVCISSEARALAVRSCDTVRFLVAIELLAACSFKTGRRLSDLRGSLCPLEGLAW